MDRRTFLATSLAASAAVISGTSSKAGAADQPSNKAKFKLKYAAHPPKFKHHAGDDMVDQIKFLADQGFRAIYDNWVEKRSVDKQKIIARELERQNMEFGPFVAHADFKSTDFVHADKDGSVRKMLVERMKQAVETAKRMNGKSFIVVPGSFDPGLQWEYQTANVIEKLKWCAQVCEKSSMIIAIEPLNPWKNHPGLFLSKMPQAYQICRTVGSPSCKIVEDIYHQQVTEGNLIPNIDAAWSEIVAFHTGDNPGRKEPTTGEINYKNIFKHLYNKGYDGVLCMEHGQSIKGKPGEKAVIDAYRICDNF